MHRSEELLDVVHSIVMMVPGANQDSLEAGDISRGGLGDLIEAETSFSAIKAVGSHSYFG